jgi:hypothetical protein
MLESRWPLLWLPLPIVLLVVAVPVPVVTVNVDTGALDSSLDIASMPFSVSISESVNVNCNLGGKSLYFALCVRPINRPNICSRRFCMIAVSLFVVRLLTALLSDVTAWFVVVNSALTLFTDVFSASTLCPNVTSLVFVACFVCLISYWLYVSSPSRVVLSTRRCCRSSTCCLR